MAKFGSKLNVSPIKAADLKKEIVKKNKELKTKNSSLSKLIKDVEGKIKQAEKHLKKIDDHIFDRQMSLDSIDVTLIKRKSSLKDKDKQLKEVINSLSKRMSEKILLEGEIDIKKEQINKYNTEVILVRDNIKHLESKEQELGDIKEDIKKYKKTASSAKHTAKRAQADCEFKKAASEKTIREIQEKVNKSQALIIDMDKQLSQKVLEYKQVTKSQDDIMTKKTEEIEFAQNKKTDMETAISNYKQDIIDLLHIIDEKKDEIKQVKQEYSNFKLKAFDEMARLKMKGKLENIDKAGLGDVFTK